MAFSFFVFWMIFLMRNKQKVKKIVEYLLYLSHFDNRHCSFFCVCLMRKLDGKWSEKWSSLFLIFIFFLLEFPKFYKFMVKISRKALLNPFVESVKNMASHIQNPFPFIYFILFDLRSNLVLAPNKEICVLLLCLSICFFYYVLFCLVFY